MHVIRICSEDQVDMINLIFIIIMHKVLRAFTEIPDKNIDYEKKNCCNFGWIAVHCGIALSVKHACDSASEFVQKIKLTC